MLIDCHRLFVRSDKHSRQQFHKVATYYGEHNSVQIFNKHIDINAVCCVAATNHKMVEIKAAATVLKCCNILVVRENDLYWQMASRSQELLVRQTIVWLCLFICVGSGNSWTKWMLRRLPRLPLIPLYQIGATKLMKACTSRADLLSFHFMLIKFYVGANCITLYVHWGKKEGSLQKFYMANRCYLSLLRKFMLKCKIYTRYI